MGTFELGGAPVVAFDFRVSSKSKRAATNHHDTIHPAAESTGKDAPGQVLRASDGRGKTQRRAPSARNNKRTRPKVRKLRRVQELQIDLSKICRALLHILRRRDRQRARLLGDYPSLR